MLKLILVLCAIQTATGLQAVAADQQTPGRLEAQQETSKSRPTILSTLSPSARQLAEQLNIVDLVEKLSSEQAAYEQQSDLTTLGRIFKIRQKILMLMQHAAFEVEESLASIDGDLALTNMQLTYVSAKRERNQMMNNVATFVGTGTFGLLDSSSSIKVDAPTPQILGIISNSIATGLPLWGLRRQKYAQPRASSSQANVLAPILNRPYSGVAYDPIVWNYLSSNIPGKQVTRLAQLRRDWAKYRRVATTGSTRDKALVDLLANSSEEGRKISPDVLKTRSELLLDLRALVQNMYKDISEVNGALLEL